MVRSIRAYGGACGEIVETGLENLRPKSWHWIAARIDRVEKVNHFGKDLAVFRLIGLIIDGPFGLPVFGAIL